MGLVVKLISEGALCFKTEEHGQQFENELETQKYKDCIEVLVDFTFDSFFLVFC